MEIDDYITLFRNECVSLQEPDRLQALQVLESRHRPQIFMLFEKLRESGQLGGERFERALKDFYWLCR